MFIRSRFSVTTGVVFLFSLSVILFWGCETRSEEPPLPKPALTKGPYLACLASHEMTILWRTDKPIKPRLTIERIDGQGKNISPLQSIPVMKIYEDSWQYEARVRGLAPDTVYRYAIFNGTEPLAVSGEGLDLKFTTAPETGSQSAIRFFVVGDSGVVSPETEALVAQIVKMNSLEGKNYNFFMNVGDIAYPDGTFDQFEEKYLGLYGPIIQKICGWPTIGNHETHSSKVLTQQGPYFDLFVLPKDGSAGGVPSHHESYYSFDFGNLHVISLDSEENDRSDTGEMVHWLKRDLSSTKGAKWIAAFWHRPPYTVGRHDADIEKECVEMRTNIVPVLEHYGVDLVFLGHTHLYARSHLLSGADGKRMLDKGDILDSDDTFVKTDGKGTVYVIAGHGGAKLDHPPEIPFMKVIVSEFGFVDVDIEDTMLTARMIDQYGNLRDSFSIIKK